jgi:hypothetical protein
MTGMRGPIPVECTVLEHGPRLWEQFSCPLPGTLAESRRPSLESIAPLSGEFQGHVSPIQKMN